MTPIENDLEDLYENAPCGHFSMLPDGKICRMNQTLLNWLGFSAAEVVGHKRFQGLIPLGERIFFETQLAPLLQMHGSLQEAHLNLIRKDKTLIPVLISVSQNKAERGDRILRVSVFNIADRKKYESELINDKRLAMQVAKAKTDFISLLSHEIRTPLGAVLGVANLLNSTSLSESQKKYVNMLTSSSENLMSLLNSILTFSKITSGKMDLNNKDFSLRELLDNVIMALMGQAEAKGISLVVKTAPGAREFLFGDPVKIGQILMNLLGNAVKFTERGSVTLSVSTAETEDDNAALISFEVADTGIGISPQQLAHIFDEYAQADEEIAIRFGGSGLGLAISNKLAELMGSRITVTSQVGAGSKFKFELPLKLGKQTQNQIDLRSADLASKSLLEGMRVLVADDNEDNQMLLGHFLENWGVDFTLVEDGAAALEKAKLMDFDLVLMDRNMEKMNGNEAAAAIRKIENSKRSRVPIIAFSAGSKDDSPASEIAEARYDDFLAKPYRPEELFRKLARFARPRLSH